MSTKQVLIDAAELDRLRNDSQRLACADADMDRMRAEFAAAREARDALDNCHGDEEETACGKCNTCLHRELVIAKENAQVLEDERAEVAVERAQEKARLASALAEVERLANLFQAARNSLGFLISPAQSTVEGVAEVADRCRRAEADVAARAAQGQGQAPAALAAHDGVPPAETSSAAQREAIARLIEAQAEHYPVDIFPADGTRPDDIAAKMARHLCKVLAEQVRALEPPATAAAPEAPTAQEAPAKEQP